MSICIPSAPTALRRLHACGKRDASSPQLPPSPSTPPKTTFQFQSKAEPRRPDSAVGGSSVFSSAVDMAAVSTAGCARSAASAAISPEKSAVDGAATSRTPSRGRPPRTTTPAPDSASLAWPTVTPSRNASMIRVREARTG